MSEEIDIDYVASLARIHLTDEEKQTFAGQLHHVLEHFDKIKAVDVDGVEPTAHAFPVYNVLEADQAEPGFTPEEALRNAPAQRNNQVIVPKVIDGGE
ncbi:MAG: Asp-tRNA(Asn)/Glu-tRNA(Gln) amidotransferase subunit GatC [Verrucomicrobiota bacterium]